jgi:hypothetical protein
MQLFMRVYIILLMCISLSVDAAGIGTVTEQLNSPADILRQTTKLVANKGTGIEMNDSVRTQQGKVGITFEDNTRVQVNENSKLVIDDFVYDPKAKTGKIAMKMALGTVRYASGAIAHNSPAGVSINTPSATISVRGTDFTATVDELGQSTVILLPSCPDNRNKSRTVQDIERDCVTGSIIVESDVGQVILNQPFQATRVESRGLMPAKPVILRLSEDAIGNMLMLSPPRELSREDHQTKTRLEMRSALDVDFLKEQGLVNALDAQAQEFFQDKLSRNFLNQDFLANILDILDAQMKAQLDLLNTTSNKLLPDYVALSGITVEIDEPRLTLARDNGSDVMSVTVPTSQNTTIYMNQGTLEFKNRVNSGGGTIITLTQK